MAKLKKNLKKKKKDLPTEKIQWLKTWGYYAMITSSSFQVIPSGWISGISEWELQLETIFVGARFGVVLNLFYIYVWK